MNETLEEFLKRIKYITDYGIVTKHKQKNGLRCDYELVDVIKNNSPSNYYTGRINSGNTNYNCTIKEIKKTFKNKNGDLYDVILKVETLNAPTEVNDITDDISRNYGYYIGSRLGFTFPSTTFYDGDHIESGIVKNFYIIKHNYKVVNEVIGLYDNEIKKRYYTSYLNYYPEELTDEETEKIIGTTSFYVNDTLENISNIKIAYEYHNSKDYDITGGYTYAKLTRIPRNNLHSKELEHREISISKIISGSGENAIDYDSLVFNYYLCEEKDFENFDINESKIVLKCSYDIKTEEKIEGQLKFGDIVLLDGDVFEEIEEGKNKFRYKKEIEILVNGRKQVEKVGEPNTNITIDLFIYEELK